jgi:hypothetical protein
MGADLTSPAPVDSATRHSVPSLHFELYSVEGCLEEMDGAGVCVDDELAIRPIRLLSAPIRSSSANCSKAATDDGAATTSSYNGNQTTIADASGAARTLTTDCLGRMTSVVEDPAGKNYQTTYAYDLLNDLKTGTQGSLLRTFSYDALQRLVTAANPENSAALFKRFFHRSSCSSGCRALKTVPGQDGSVKTSGIRALSD